MRDQAISMVRGNSEVFALTITDADTGNPYILAQGDVLRFGVKQSKNSQTRILEKELEQDNSEDAEEGSYTLYLEPKDTLHMPLGEYWYDIGVQIGEDYYTVIDWSPFVLTPNATEWTGGGEG